MPGLIIFDPNDENIGLSVGDDQANSVFLDIEDGKMYIADLTKIYEWEGAATNMTYTWQSSKIRLPRPVNLGAAIVEAETYADLTFKLYAELNGSDTLIATRTITDHEPVRLPGGYQSNVFYAEVIGTDRVSRIAVAQNIFELAEE